MIRQTKYWFNLPEMCLRMVIVKKICMLMGIKFERNRSTILWSGNIRLPPLARVMGVVDNNNYFMGPLFIFISQTLKVD